MKRRIAQAICAGVTLACVNGASAQTVPDFLAPATFVSNDLSNTGPSTYWSAAGDFNGDGFTDLAAPDGRVTDNIYGFSVVFGTPNGGFTATVPQPIGLYTRSLHAADFNHDGCADLLLDTTSGAKVIFGHRNGQFSAPQPILVPVGSNHGAITDFNGDGNADVVVAGDNGYGVALGNGDGTFTIGPIFRQDTPTYWVVTGDFNRDGFADFTGSGGIFGVTYLGNGDGTFKDAVSGGFTAGYGSIAADFNNDGALDLVTTTAQHRQDGSNFAITIALGWGDGSFSSYSSYVFGDTIRGLAVGDFNDDGNQDVATYLAQTGQVRVLAGRGDYTLFGDLLNSTESMPSGVLLSADVDGNGSVDLIQADYHTFRVFRSTHGNPPLLAGFTLTPAAAIGGAATSGVVVLGGPAPAGGAVVALSSSDASLAAVPATVTVAEGATSATFAVATTAVTTPASAVVMASWNGVTTDARLDLVPAYVLSGLSISPASQYGTFTSTGTVTLSQPADAGAVVTLTSNNAAVATVPASVTVPAGATSVDFTITLRPVTVNTPVNIVASRAGVSFGTPVTVLKAADSVSVSKAILTRKTGELRLEVNGTNEAATITAYNTANGAFLGTLTNDGGGRYRGSVTLAIAASAPATFTLKSSLGGTVTATAQSK